MLRTRHKSWFGVATADMFITSEHQPLGFGGCSQGTRIDSRNVVVALEVTKMTTLDLWLASLLWRMRRATTIETDVLKIALSTAQGPSNGFLGRCA
jgi:hypothetical protein